MGFQIIEYLLKDNGMDFLGGPVINTSHFHCGDTGSIPGPLVREVPHAARCSQKQTKKDNGIDISIMVD